MLVCAKMPSSTSAVESATPATPAASVSADASSILERRRRSFVPMSSMEEESLRERLHLAQLRQCSEIVFREQKYAKDGFRRVFQSEVGFCESGLVLEKN